VSLSPTGLVRAVSVDSRGFLQCPCPGKALALDCRGSGNFRDSANLHDPAQSDQQYVASHHPSGGRTRRPRPLKIEATQMSRNVHNLADEEQSSNFVAFHRFG
jgi:hypothetical protein